MLKCQGKMGLKSLERSTYRFDGGLVNFGFRLPQMMSIYEKRHNAFSMNHTTMADNIRVKWLRVM